ncbi:MAG: DUF1983 domain-containing protein [Pararobbsia sp.]
MAAISDQNAQAVISALVNGWLVRNAQSGDGSNAFVTRADLGLTAGNGASAAGSGSPSTGVTPGGTAFLQSGLVTALVSQVSASILASAFFQELGSSVGSLQDAVKKAQNSTGLSAAIEQEATTRADADEVIQSEVTTQFATLNDNLAAIQETMTTTANSVAANASDIEELQSSVGGQSAALEQEAETRASADGQLEAQWFIKTDINGYISGFGLSSTANNGIPTSSFIVRADEFAIGSPTGPGIAPTSPFVVLTTPTDIGGQIAQPGTYISDAFIANGSIDTAQIALAAITQALIANAAIGTAQIQTAAIGMAQIGFAAIDTLRLAGRCVTVQAAFQVSATGGSFIYTSSGGEITVSVGVQSDGRDPSGDNVGIGFIATMDGGQFAAANGFGQTWLQTVNAVGAPAAGPHTFSFTPEIEAVGGSMTSPFTVTVFEAMH